MTPKHEGYFHSPDDDELRRQANKEVFDTEKDEMLAAVSAGDWNVDHQKLEKPDDRFIRGRVRQAEEGVTQIARERAERSGRHFRSMLSSVTLAEAAASARLSRR